MARVLILGGGSGGLAAAAELRALLPTDDEIVLVAASDRFFMGFAKLWDLSGQRSLDHGTRPLALLEDRGVRFVHAEVTGIDPASRGVSTTSGDLTADAVIVALGTVPSPAHLDLLAAGEGHNLYDYRHLPAMRAALGGVTSGRVVVAVLGGPFKCPPAPYETALIVDEQLRRPGRARRRRRRAGHLPTDDVAGGGARRQRHPRRLPRREGCLRQLSADGLSR